MLQSLKPPPCRSPRLVNNLLMQSFIFAVAHVKMERWARTVYPDSLGARVVSTLPVRLASSTKFRSRYRELKIGELFGSRSSHSFLQSGKPAGYGRGLMMKWNKSGEAGGIRHELATIIRQGAQVWRLIPWRHRLSLAGAVGIMSVASAANTAIALCMGRSDQRGEPPDESRPVVSPR